MADQPTESSRHFNLQHEERTVKVYTLTEDEIDSIGALDLMGTIALAFFTTFTGSAITFWLTADLDNPYATGVLGVLAVAMLACAGIFVWSALNNRDRRTRIKQRVND